MKIKIISTCIFISTLSFAQSKIIFGYHPYWAPPGAYKTYDYSVLTTIGYFSYEVDPATGSYITTHGWNYTPIISYAHQRGVKVVLVVTNFGFDENDAILTDTLKQDNLIQNLINLLKQRNGDGVNIDFERIRSERRGDLVRFMKRLVSKLKKEIPSAEVSMTIPPVDWRNAFDTGRLSQICDYLILMGYGYSWSGSSRAGPVAPLEGTTYNVKRSVNTYLSTGVPPNKLVLGVPLYGYDWPVVDSTKMSQTTGKGSPIYYKDAEPKAKTYGKKFDQTTKTPWFNYRKNSNWHQVWYDDSLSLSFKYELVNLKSLAGVSFWALSYEGGRKEIWNGIKSAFTSIISSEPTPSDFELYQNYPNPFNSQTVIKYKVPKLSHIKLTLYDLLGQVVKVLFEGEKAPGEYKLVLNSSGLPSGAYLCTLEANGLIKTIKMVLVK